MFPHLPRKQSFTGFLLFTLSVLFCPVGIFKVVGGGGGGDQYSQVNLDRGSKYCQLYPGGPNLL